MGVYRAYGVQATGRDRCFTRVQAMSTDAGLIRYAVVISSATNDTGVEVADETKWTVIVSLAVCSLDDLLTVASSEWVSTLCLAAAEGSMVFRSTNRILSTGSVDAARILTALIDAGHRVGASVVRSTGVNALAVLAYLSCSAVDVLQTDWDYRNTAKGVCVAGVPRWT